MTFTGNELAAILKLGKMMAKADGRIDDNEMMVLTNELLRFGVQRNQIHALEELGNTMGPDALLATVFSMDADQKKYVTAYLGVILAIDNNIDDAEMRLWSMVTMLCDLPEMTIGEAMRFLDNL